MCKKAPPFSLSLSFFLRPTAARDSARRRSVPSKDRLCRLRCLGENRASCCCALGFSRCATTTARRRRSLAATTAIAVAAAAALNWRFERCLRARRQFKMADQTAGNSFEFAAFLAEVCCFEFAAFSSGHWPRGSASFASNSPSEIPPIEHRCRHRHQVGSQLFELASSLLLRLKGDDDDDGDGRCFCFRVSVVAFASDCLSTECQIIILP